jgi:O-antigen/teichoic acid export membrane protein
VFLGFLLSQLLSIPVALLVVKLSRVLVITHQATGLHEKSRKHFSKLLSEIIPIAAVTAVMALLSNYDMILVKHYFDAFNAGIYAGTLTLGKIILFGAGSVATVMYPRVVSNKKSKASVLRLAKQFTLIQVVFILIPLLCYIVLPSFITTLFFGEKYISSIPFLPIYALFIGFWVLINYILTFLIALDEKKIALFVPVFFVGQFLGISIFHDSLYQVVWVNFGVGFTFVLFASGYFIKTLRKL